MAWGFRRSRKLAPGIRLNLSKRGGGLSVGGRGARLSLSSRGRRMASLSRFGLFWRRRV
jgi:hypothetical protein